MENANIKECNVISYSLSDILYEVVTFELWMTCGSFAGSHESSKQNIACYVVIQMATMKIASVSEYDAYYILCVFYL